ncbi:hypothetical protein F2Q70_00042610 [Brassica cretica]|uniref:Uncharacterized protein n=1 Tax=Brassica cretica TaxID=69181 RepID=A0A8S9KIN3_BRACR|nr:hypothetical protein F2Q70_00042610 [Brassica cretica]
MMLPSNGSLEMIESSANSVVSLMKVVGVRLRSGAIVMATDGHNGILSHQEGCNGDFICVSLWPLFFHRATVLILVSKDINRGGELMSEPYTEA